MWRHRTERLSELRGMSDVRAWLQEFHAAGASLGGTSQDGQLESLRDRVALLAAVHAARRQPERAVLFLRGPGCAAAAYVRRLTALYQCAFTSDPFRAPRTDTPNPARQVIEFERDRLGGAGESVFSSCSIHDTSSLSIEDREPVTFLVVEGATARPMVRSEIGTHLMVDRPGSLVPVQLGRLPAGPDEGEHGPPGLSRRVDDALRTWDEALREWEAGRSGRDRGADDVPHPPLRHCFDETRRAWLDRVGRGEATFDEDPFPMGPVVRIHDEGTATVDLRTRMSVAGWPEADDLWAFLGAGLPLGDETD